MIVICFVTVAIALFSLFLSVRFVDGEIIFRRAEVEAGSWDAAGVFGAGLVKRSISSQVYYVQVRLRTIYVFMASSVSYGFGSERLRAGTRAGRQGIIYANMFSHYSFSLCATITGSA